MTPRAPHSPLSAVVVVVMMAMALVMASLLVSSAPVLEEPLLPGVKVLLAQEGLDLLTDRVLDMIIQDLLSTPIDDVEGVVKVPVIGEVEYAMTEIKITSADIKGLKAELKAPNVVNLKEDSIELGLSLKWAYKKLKFPKTSGKGDAIGVAKEAVLTCAVAVTNVDNKPHLAVVSDKVELGDMDITIRGGTSGWILNMLKSLFKNQIREAANKSIRRAMVDAIDNRINQIIAETSFVFPLEDSGLAVDARIAGDIAVTDHGFISIGSKAEVLDLNNPQPAPYKPANLPSGMILPDTEFNMYITEYPALSAGFAALSAGLFEQTITRDMIPESSPIQLDTTSLKFTLPDLYKAYPDRDIVMKTRAIKPPMAKVTPEGMGAAMNITVSFFVVEEDKSLLQTFDINFGAVPHMDKVGVISDKGGKVLNITGHVAALGVNGRLEKSYMGEIDVSKFINLIKILTNSGLLSHVNKILGPGYPLRLPEGVIVEDASVKLEKGFVALAANVDYNPPAQSNIEKRHERMARILENIDLYNRRITRLQEMITEVIEMEMVA